MKYIDADRLRSEIEKRKQIHFNDYFVKKSGNPADYGASNALAQVLPLIDSLQQEQPSLPSDLDEAAKECAKTTFKKPYSDNPDEEVTIVEPDKYAGFIAGAKWDKEQMMSNAVEGTVYGNGVYTWVAGDIPSQFKYGDKVRVIVLPKED